MMRKMMEMNPNVEDIDENNDYKRSQEASLHSAMFVEDVEECYIDQARKWENF